MKKLLNLFPVFLIILGSALEIYYYSYRFTMDGINIYIALTISISLTLLLTMLARYYKTKIVFWLLIPLAAFSIFNTSAGQAFSLGEKYNQETIEEAQQLNKQSDIDYYQNKISELNNEYNNLETQKNNTITSLADRYHWKNTLAKMEARQDEIKLEIKESESVILNLRPELTINEEVEKQETNIYKFYNNLFGLNPKWLQFILQTVLSFFIAAMAPIGIIILSTRKPEPEKKIVRKKLNYLPLIKRWVTISWTGKRKNNNKEIIKKDQFIKYYNDRFKDKKEQYRFTEAIYDKINNAAIAINSVDKKGIIVNNDSEERVISLIDNKLR